MDFLLQQLFTYVPLNVLNFIGILAILGVLILMVNPRLRDVEAQVKITNGAARDLKQWKEDHSGIDDSRHNENLASLREIRETIRAIKA